MSNQPQTAETPERDPLNNENDKSVDETEALIPQEEHPYYSQQLHVHPIASITLSSISDSFWSCLSLWLLVAVPNIISVTSGLVMLGISMHFISKTGDVDYIAGMGLGSTWINLIDIYAVETLCLGTAIYSAPAFGSKNFRLVGLTYHRSLIIKLLLVLPMYSIILLSYRLFTAIGVSEAVATNAYNYGAYFLPATILFAIEAPTRCLLITQAQYLPVAFIQFTCMFIHWGWCELFVTKLDLGVKGVALAFASSQAVSTTALLSYIFISGKFKQTLFWFERESFKGLFKQLKSELFIGAPTYLEAVFFESSILIARGFGTYQLGAWVIIINVVSIIFMIPFGSGLALSLLIGKAIGEQSMKKYKRFVKIGIYFAVLMSMVVASIFYALKKYIAEIYTGTDQELYETTLSLLTLYTIAIPSDFIQGVFLSILKAIGKEKLATYIFLIAGYLIAYPLCYGFGIIAQLEGKGMIIGFATGSYLLVILSSVILARTDLVAQAKEIYAERAEH